MRRMPVLAGALVVALASAAPAWGAQASVSGSTLTVTADGAGDTITVTWDGTQAGSYVVEAPSVTTDPTCTPDPVTPTTRVSCSRGNVAPGSYTLVVNGGPGNDTIRTIAPILAVADPTFINGGAGDDFLQGNENEDTISGNDGADTINGGSGNDVLSGGTVIGYPDFEGKWSMGPSVGAGDVVFGGANDDVITDGDTTTIDADTIDGGDCTDPRCNIPAAPAASTQAVDDALVWTARTVPVTVNFNVTTGGQGAAGENEIIRNIRTIYTGSGNDHLIGLDTPTDPTGAAKGGDDVLHGGVGDDLIEGNNGPDELWGGAGHDTIRGGEGADDIYPGGVDGALPGEYLSDGPDVIDGGPNTPVAGATKLTDLVSYVDRSDNLTLDMSKPTTLGAPGENDNITGIEDINGGYGGDHITGLPGVPNAIGGDSTPPILNFGHATARPVPPSGQQFGNDVINSRDDAADTVDCAGGTADVATIDRADGVVNCETVDVPPLPPPPPPPPGGGGSTAGGGSGSTGGKSAGTGSGGTTGGSGSAGSAGTSSTSKPTISGGASAGSVKVGANGAFTLRRSVVSCPSGGRACRVTTSIKSLGTLAYTQTAATRRSARGKLSRAALRRLRRSRRMKATIAIKVVMGGSTVTRKVRATLTAPER